MWSRLLVRPSLLTLRSSRVIKGEKIFSLINDGVRPRSIRIGSALPSFSRLFTTELHNTPELKHDIEKVEQKKQKRAPRKRSKSEDEKANTSESAPRTKRKPTPDKNLNDKNYNNNTKYNNNKNKKYQGRSDAQRTLSEADLDSDEKRIQFMTENKDNSGLVLRVFQQIKQRNMMVYIYALKAHIEVGNIYGALDLWKVMEQDPNIKMTGASYNKLMHIYYEKRDYKKMKEVYQHLVEHFRPTIETFHRMIMYATGPELGSIEEIDWLASELYKYCTGDLFIHLELFKFYAQHKLWPQANQFLDKIKAERRETHLMATYIKASTLWALMDADPSATEEINRQWDELYGALQPHEIKMHARVLFDVLSLGVLEHFAKGDGERTRQVFEVIARLARETDPKTTVLRQVIASLTSSQHLEYLQEFEQSLANHKQLAWLGDLAFLYGYFGLQDVLDQMLDRPVAKLLSVSQLQHLARGLIWHNTSAKQYRYYTAPQEGYDTPEQYARNIIAAERLIEKLHQNFNYEPTVEIRTLMAGAYIKAHNIERAKEELALVKPEDGANFILYNKTMKYLARADQSARRQMPSNAFWRDVSQMVDDENCDGLVRVISESGLNAFTPALLQRTLACFEKNRVIEPMLELCQRILDEASRKIDLPLSKTIIRVSFVYKNQELGERALEFYKTGRWQPVRLDFRITNIILNYYLYTKQLVKAEDFFKYCVEHGFVVRPFSFGRLLAFILAEGRIRDAWRYFIQQRICPLGPRSTDNHGYTSLFTALIYNNLAPYAIALFESMKEDCVLPDRFVYKQFCELILRQNKADEQEAASEGHETPEVSDSLESELPEVPEVPEVRESYARLPKLAALMKLPLDGLPELAEVKLRLHNHAARMPREFK